MREADCVWSYLFTGVPEHYARFGWGHVEQDEAVFDIPLSDSTAPLETLESGDWMHPIYDATSQNPLWQVRTELAWKTRLGPARPWPERRIVGQPDAYYAALSIGEDETAVLEWCILPGHEKTAAQGLANAVRAAGKPTLKMLKGLLEVGKGEFEAHFPLRQTDRVGRGMALPLREGLDLSELQRLFDAPRAHFSPFDAF